MALGGRGQIFHAIVAHLHGMAAPHGQQRRVAGKGGGIVLFAAECTAGLSLNHSDFFIGQIENRAQSLEDVVRALQRTPHGDAAVRAVFRDDALILNVEMFLRAGAVFALNNVRRMGPCGIYVALFQEKTFEQIVSAPDDNLLALTFFDRENRGQRFIFDPHRGHSFA